MTTRNNVKFTHANFEYYILHISLATNLEQIESKLIDFNNSSSNDENIILSFDNELNLENVTQIVSAIKKIANKLKIKIHSILANRTIPSGEILLLPIINFPKPLKKTEVLFSKTLIINEPVRSGMRIVNDGDIIVTSFVSNGAEVIATGNIHIYGDLKGKAIAGSGGDKLAKIFALKFTPELISIGGIYRIIDTKLPDNLLNNVVMVSLDDKSRLSIVAVKA